MTLVKVNNRTAPAANNWMDEIFNFPTSFGKSLHNGFTPSAPSVNVVEKEEGYSLELLAPGFEKSNFKVNVEGNLLTISGEKATEETTEQPKFIRREFNTASFKRSFTLDEKIDAASISARYENGILSLFLPKKATLKETVQSVEIK